MTATVEQTAHVAAPTRVSIGPLPATVTIVALGTALARLPFLGSPVSSDEGGFLVVAGQWHAGGGALYGHYWVDRPPLLLAIFRLADLLGGLPALRLIGCLAASLTVLALGSTVHRLLGARPALWASVAAGALLVSPGTGSVIVDGELLAAPFVAFGVAALLVALTTRERARARWASAAAGGCAVAAVLVKQNMLGVVVFAIVLLLAARTVGVPDARIRRILGCGLSGATAVATLVLGSAAILGTSPGAVFFAMYPFRLRASRVIASRTGSVYQVHAVHFAWLALATGAPLLLAMLVVLLLRRRLMASHPLVFPMAAATTALAGFDVLSISAGGSYWSHYLLQLVVPVALAAAMAVASTRRLGLVLVCVAVAASSVAWLGGLAHHADAAGQTIGTAIGRVAAPRDTIVMALGSGDVVYSSGLRSPYPYLWALPSRTLDPRMVVLRRTMAGPDAPTWFVVRGAGTGADLDAHGVGAVLRHRYRVVGQVCGRDIWLHDDVQRATPAPAGTCTAPMAAWFPHGAENGGLR